MSLSALGTSPWLAVDQRGQPVQRDRTCECGKAFKQSLLSERFRALIAKRGRRCMQLVTEQIPDGYVPVHCHSCERVDLGRQAWLDESRTHSYDREEAAD